MSTAAEVEAVLDRIAADHSRRYLVQVFPDADDQTMIEMVWGDAERAMLSYADADWDGLAVDPSLQLAASDLDYDHGSVEPDRTRLSVATARRAVAEFVTTGRRPTCVTWQP